MPINKSSTAPKKEDIEKNHLDIQLQKFFKAVEHTTDAIFITDKEGKIEYVNPGFELTTGFNKEEALGKNPRIIKSGQMPLAHYKQLWSTILAGRTFRATVVNRKKDGKLFYADHTITPIKDKKGKVTHFVGIWKDITKSVLQTKRREEFIAIASHELKNPLVSIKTYSEILERKLIGEKDKIYLLKQIKSQTKMLALLINDLLDISKIDAGKLVLEKKYFDLNSLINNIANEFNLSHPNRVIVKGKTKGKIKGSQNRISQVITNLLTNALKFSPEEAKINITITTGRTNLKIGVHDRGVGIAKSKQKKIFERFYQVTDKGHNGMGLGLYICAEIIRLHGGKIWVESIPKKGSSFYFTLPIK